MCCAVRDSKPLCERGFDRVEVGEIVWILGGLTVEDDAGLIDDESGALGYTFEAE